MSGVRCPISIPLPLSGRLRSDDPCPVCDGTALSSCDATRLRVTGGGLTPQEISHFVSEEARVLITDPWKAYCENDQELALDVDQGILQGHAHWDPIVKG